MRRESEHRGRAGGQAILGHLLQIVMIKLERQLRQQPGDDESSRKNYIAALQNFLIDLEENYHHCHEVSIYADRVGVTPRQLSHIANKHLGMTAKQIINDRLMLESKRYLQFTNYSVKEISFMLGFEDPSYFSKVFNRFTGTTPQEFRLRRSGRSTS